MAFIQDSVGVRPLASLRLFVWQRKKTETGSAMRTLPLLLGRSAMGLHRPVCGLVADGLGRADFEGYGQVPCVGRSDCGRQSILDSVVQASLTI